MKLSAAVSGSIPPESQQKIKPAEVDEVLRLFVQICRIINA